MTLQMPNGYWVIITIFVMSQPNAGASLVKGLQRFVATLAGAAASIFIIAAFAQNPWFMLVALGSVCGFGLFLSRTSTAPYVGLLAAMTPAILIGLAGENPQIGVVDGLWRGAAVALGVLIGTAAQLWVWPEDPEELLLTDLASILARVETELTRLVASAARPSVERSEGLLDGAFQGLGRQLDWLSNSEAVHLGLRQRHGEQLVLIGSVHRLATAALGLGEVLETAASSDGPSPRTRARVASILARCARMRAAVERRHVLAPVPMPHLDAADHAGAAAPSLLELERALDEMEAASGFLGVPPAEGAPVPVPASPLDQGTGPYFLTPAFSLSNTLALRFAIKGGLAAVLAYVLVQAWHWPGIGTAVVTAVIVAQSSFGAMVQKAALRLAGAVLGGLLGIVTVVYAMPVMEDLSSLLVVTAFATGIAAYVLAGSARTSYAGIQIGLAWALTILVELGPTTDLVPARDRVIGIVVGIVIALAVFRAVWPELASVGMRNSVVASLRHLAQLSYFALPGGLDAALSRPSGGFRWQVTKDFADALRLAAESRLEPQSGSDESRATQEATVRVLDSAQSTFLALLAVVRHRLNAGLLDHPAEAHQPMLALALAVGPFLEGVAERVESTRDAPVPDTGALLENVRRAITALRVAVSSGSTAVPELVEFETRLTLYETLVTHLQRLDARSQELVSVAASPREN